MAYLFGLDPVSLEFRQTLDHELEFKEELDRLVWGSRAVLYVGWRPETREGASLLAALRDLPFGWPGLPVFRRVALVEAWESNLAAFKEPGVRKIHGDVADYREFLGPEEICCAIWQDGPEHMGAGEGRALIERMKGDFQAIVLSSPDGEMGQGALDGNLWEEHKSAWAGEDYREAGFKVVGYSAGLIGFWRRDG